MMQRILRLLHYRRRLPTSVQADDATTVLTGQSSSNASTEEFTANEPPQYSFLSRSKWQAVLEALPDPALVVDDTGTIQFCNTLVTAMYPRVTTGRAITLLSRNPDFLSSLRSDRVSNGPAIIDLHDRVPVSRHMSALISHLDFGVEVSDETMTLIILRDLTDQQKHAQMRSDFIAYASHELRTPLASIKLMIETMLGSQAVTEEKREYFLSMMLGQATRMARLIDDLLSLSRIEMNTHVPPRGIVELHELIAEVIPTLEPLAKESGIRLVFDNQADKASTMGEWDDLTQVIQNLVQNAIRYGRKDGSVTIRMTRTKSRTSRPQIRISIIDDGMGIEPEHIPRLTERFYRVSAAESRAKGGTGLGLAIVKHIISRHRGELEIKSVVGEGSEFAVVLSETVQKQNGRGTSSKE